MTRLVDEINKFQYNRKDGNSKIPVGILKDTNKQIKLSAIHAWTLIRIVVVILGTRFKSNPIYLHFCSLIEITRMLTNDCFDPDKLESLSEKIHAYLTKFKELHPEIPISAKMHNLIHYPRRIRMSGTPLSKWTMRFDSKHRYFKQVHAIVHNHVNLLKSLAYRHQNLLLYHFLSEV